MPIVPLENNGQTYIGMRYVPVYGGVWDNTKAYEYLTLVNTTGDNSAIYISMKNVPAGTKLTNTDYWLLYSSNGGDISNIEQEIIALQTAVNSQSTEITSLNSGLTTAQANITTLQATQQTQGQTISTLESTQETQGVTISSIQTDVDNQDTRISAL